MKQRLLKSESALKRLIVDEGWCTSAKDELTNEIKPRYYPCIAIWHFIEDAFSPYLVATIIYPENFLSKE